MLNKVLMVCMGNICRSPMAEGLFREYLRKIPNISVTSAGIAALEGYKADPFAQKVLNEKKGIDISAHTARQLSSKIVLEADLILVMEMEHQKKLEYNFPGVYGRVHRLGKWSGFDIPDPYRRSELVFEQTLILIDQCFEDWFKRLWK